MRADDDLIGKADALMHRYRSYVARPPSPPPAEPTPEEDETLPLLTEVVSDAASKVLDASWLGSVQGELEAALSAWLEAALPTALAAATPQLFAALEADARQTLLPNLLETLKHGITRQKL
ncbi:hypothetical protein [Sulfuricystis multivorans]|uniref:hypothetical protein n=1 Tax=Sulfuricystis multivorans TaxID=2211108 RepID=UPI000F81C2BB|nr:hypothetical protein [Sulfuricystis multivorans]